MNYEKDAAELARQMEELIYSDERYRIAAQNSSEIILDYNLTDDSIYHVTNRITEVYGAPQYIERAPEYLIGCGAIQPESAEDFRNVFRQLHDGVPRVSCVLKTKTAWGEICWAELNLTTVLDAGNRPVRAIGVLKDITLQREAELRYADEVQRRNAMVKDALLYYEVNLTSGLVLDGLEAVLGSLGVTYTDQMDESVRLLVEHMVYPEDREKVRLTFAQKSLLEKHAQGVDKVELEYRRLGETSQGIWVRGTAYISEDAVSGVVKAYYYVNDINSAKQRELKYRAQAERDLLTGLYNKVTSEALIQGAIEAGESEGCVGAFLIVDLDNFKNVNDRLGHAFGDAVLSEIAHKLKSICRADDVAGRIGGDEFVLYFKHLPNKWVAEKKASDICDFFHKGDSGDGESCNISGSVGIAFLPEHGSSFEELYRKADLALYSAKGSGKDAYCVYSADAAVRTLSPRATIDRSSGKAFSENIIEYVFRILYESNDLPLAIGGVLELVAKHFGYSRGYIYEMQGDGACACTFEWCANQVEPLPPVLRTLGGGDLLERRQNFGPSGFYHLQSQAELTETERRYPAFKTLTVRVQYMLHSNGNFQGYLGFDRYGEGSPPTADQLSSLQGVAQMVGVFLAEKHSNEKLVESGTMLQAVADSLRTCTYIVDPETHVLQFVNQNARQIIPQAVPGTLCYETVRGRSVPCDDCPIAKMSRDHLKEYQGEMYLDRYELWANINTSFIRLADGKEYGLFNGYDFAEYRKQNGQFAVGVNAFTKDSHLYDALTLSTDDYIFLCDLPKNLFYFPKAMAEEFGFPAQVLEDAIPLWATRIHEGDRQAFLRDIKDLLAGESTSHDQEYRICNREGNWVWMRCRGSLELDPSGKPALFAGIMTNLGKKSKIDHLTGLPNKYEFEARVRSDMERVGNCGALLLLGIDNFKYINNLYSWEFGDQVIRETARRMQGLLPRDIQLYRLDGDMFAAYFTDTGAEAVIEAYQHLYEAFQQRQQHGGHRYFCTVSGGYAVFAGGASSFTALYKQAEFAFEHSKTEGKNQLNRYDDSVMSGRARMLRLVARLQESVEDDFEGFDLYYQPQVEPVTQTVRSAEALLRWRNTELGVVPPDEFIPVLEQTGLIHKVGRWVLERAAKTSRDWRQMRNDFTINVNISFAQLQDKSFLPYLAQLVENGTILPEALHLELTESCITSGSRSLVSTFQFLRDLGFRIEMDDFGTGYSSLEILKNAPADVVKIDQAFVMDITKSDFDATFIQFIVSLCHSVGIKVCLEGVETWAEYYLVEPMGLDLIQGYLFGRAQPRSEFEKHYFKT